MTPIPTRPRGFRRRAVIAPVAAIACSLALAAGIAFAAEPVQGQETGAIRGDPAAGERVFARCRSCHQVGEKARNLVGPNLNGIVGRHSGSVDGYRYSEALGSSGLVWDEATLRDFLKNPRAKVPGTKMAAAGISSDGDLSNLVAYLAQFAPDGTKPP